MGNRKSNTIQQINKDFLNVDSVSEFNELLTDFQEDPALHKAYADLLLKQNSSDEAALSYGKSAALYLKSGKLIPAVNTKILQWRIKSPAYQDTQLFLSALNDSSLPETPLMVFFKNLSIPELLAVLNCMEGVQLPAGQLIYKIDNVQENLYFIVSGKVREIRYEPVKTGEETVYNQSIEHLSIDDTFGELYPIEKENLSQSFVETTDPTELLKISKAMLLPICKKYPNVESGLEALGSFRSEFRKARLLKKNRKSQRHKITRKMSLEIFPHSSANYPIILDAYSKDISVGGACVFLDANDLSVAKSVASFSKTIKKAGVKISMPSEGMELRVSGKIVWTKETTFEGGKTLAVGIQFEDLSPRLRGMLFVFADGSKDK